MMNQLIKIIIENESYIYNWIEGEPDHIEKDGEYFLIYINRKAETVYNLDKTINDILNNTLICPDILDIINIMNDFGFDTEDIISQKTYDKLFWGCNLPSVTPEGKEYEPIWNEKEKNEILSCVTQLKEIRKKSKF